MYPKNFMDQYNIRENFKDGYIYLEIQRSVYGLTQSGMLDNKRLKYIME